MFVRVLPQRLGKMPTILAYQVVGGTFFTLRFISTISLVFYMYCVGCVPVYVCSRVWAYVFEATHS